MSYWFDKLVYLAITTYNEKILCDIQAWIVIWQGKVKALGPRQSDIVILFSESHFFREIQDVLHAYPFCSYLLELILEWKILERLTNPRITISDIRRMFDLDIVSTIY